MTTSPAVPLTVDQIIDELERAVFQRRTPDATKLLIELLKAITGARTPTGILPLGTPPERRRAAYTRIAAMISALICSPDFQLEMGQIDFISSLKPVLEAIFELSGYGGPEHLLQYVGKPNEDGTRTLHGVQVFVLSLFYSLDNLPPELLQGVVQLPPNQMLPLYAGWFASPFVHHPRGEQNRAVLIENSSKIETAYPTSAGIGAVNTAWMHCSYADHPDKHQVKRSLNEVWRRLASGSGLKSNHAPRTQAERPTVVILAERMLSGHAMQRSYARSIQQLRRRFRTVCVAVLGQFSEELQSEFDEAIVLPGSMNIKDIGARLVKLQPDIIYYPSLGMSEWTQMMANFRFAPIQLMTLGHPAPAMCDTMDYSLVQAGHGEAAKEFGNKVIERKAWGHFAPFDESIAFDMPKQPFEDGRIHIAVNSSLMKLSPRFLSLCERIEAEAKRPVHFHFFASATGVMFDRISQVFESRFRHFTLEPARRYQAFLHRLNDCDLALAAFPFGNTNSTVDTCLLGVPTVAYYANEVLSIGDRDVMRMVGLPSWLVADNDEDYFQTAMKLIHDDDARQAIVDQLKSTDVKAKLFQPPRPEDETEFVDAFWWIYENHEALQASSQHLLKVGEPIPA